MLRLNVYCSIIPSATQVKLGSAHGSWIINYHKARKSSWGVSVRALKDDQTDGGRSSSAGRSWDPGLEIEVPFEQRPVCLTLLCVFMLVPLLIQRHMFCDNELCRLGRFHLWILHLESYTRLSTELVVKTAWHKQSCRQHHISKQRSHKYM